VWWTCALKCSVLFLSTFFFSCFLGFSSRVILFAKRLFALVFFMFFHGLFISYFIPFPPFPMVFIFCVVHFIFGDLFAGVLYFLS